MLYNYSNVYPELTDNLIKIINNNKLSHAYIFDFNSNPDGMDIVYSFINDILCFNIKDETKIANIRKKIFSGNYIDLKIIEAETIIKKEQIIELQNEYSKLSIENNKKIYIIKDADKMNKQAANTLLKFLEEPVDDIIGILVTNNVNLLLPTIISRCQLIRIPKPIFSTDSFVNFRNIIKECDLSPINIDKEEILESFLSLFIEIENDKIDVLVEKSDFIYSIFGDKEYLRLGLELMLNFYYDMLKSKINSSNFFFYTYIKKINELSSNYDVSLLYKKIIYIVDTIDDLRYNINSSLLLDKLIIELCGV